MEQIVHIIPLGYEIDRAVKPFESPTGFKANTAYLLSSVDPISPSDVQHKHYHYYQTVKTRLEALGIKVISIELDLFDFFDVLSKISYIIKQEQNNGNIVYVNVSSAGRLTAIGTALAAMVHKARIYYTESDEYSDTPEKWLEHGSTIVQDLRLKFLEQFIIQLPNELQQQTLVELYKRQRMNTMEIIQHLATVDSTLFPPNYEKMTRPQKITLSMKISRRVLNQLESTGYILKEKYGRENYYLLTESGKNMAAISGKIAI
jgi:predicted transcriptional regulator